MNQEEEPPQQQRHHVFWALDPLSIALTTTTLTAEEAAPAAPVARDAITMTTPQEEAKAADATAGPSKNELKKLAKKAEKAAKKQQHGGGGAAATPTAAAAATDPAAATAATAPKQPPRSPVKAADATATAAAAAAAAGVVVAPASALAVTGITKANKNKTTLLNNIRLANPSEDTATLKVVWTSLLLGKADDLGACYTTYLKQSTSSTNSHKHATALLLNDDVVSGGGNSMACTLAAVLCSTTNNKKLSVADQLLQDEWCEWERTVLRPSMNHSHHDHHDNSDNKTHVQQREAALAHLTLALEKTGGAHVLSSCFSVADVLILSTLLDHPDDPQSQHVLDHIHKNHALVHRYMMAHASHFQAAVAQRQICRNKAILAQPSLSTTVALVFDEVIQHVFGHYDGSILKLPETKNLVNKCSSPKLGDYQCSAAMPIFAALKAANLVNDEFKSPQDVAKAIITAIGNDHPVVMDLQVNGPGFMTCRLQPSFLEIHVNALITSSTLPLPNLAATDKNSSTTTTTTTTTCVVDFSSPNIAKEMHVGHLRSTIIGEAVCRILELVPGYRVHRVNHVGDWGTQFGMLIEYLRQEYPNVANASSSNDSSNSSEAESLPNITDLTGFYKAAKERFDADPEFKKQSQLNVVELQSGNPECLRIWEMLCNISRREFDQVYRRLDVTVTECGESFYNDKIPAVIAETEQKGLLSKDEQQGGAAKLLFVDDFKVPLMLQKTDGGYGYDSTDMAALKYRLQALHADRIIYITDFTQGDHFEMIKKAGVKLGWIDAKDAKRRIQHIGFGTVQGEDGRRFKTRSGDTVRLVDLLDEAVSRMEESLTMRISEGKANITLEEVHETAEAIGYGAVKYFDLRRNPTSNYKFSYDQMLDTKGDTAVYLLYARVRLESILAKAKTDFDVGVDDLIQRGERIHLKHASERNLACHLQLFPDVLLQTLDDLYPYHICEYVYKLAIAASDFVTQCKVLLGKDDPDMPSRLLLCHATIMAMHQTFDLLGIRHVKRI